MIIKVNFSSLRDIRWHEYLTRFALGGAISVATGLIAKAFGPITGGLFLALPAIFPASATLLEKHERDKKRHAGIAFTAGRGLLNDGTHYLSDVALGVLPDLSGHSRTLERLP